MACRCCHLDHEQLDYGCNSRNFQQRWLLAFTFRFVNQLALFSEEDPVTQFVVLGTRSTRLCLEKPLDKFGRSPSAETRGSEHFKTEPSVSWRRLATSWRR